MVPVARGLRTKGHDRKVFEPAATPAPTSETGAGVLGPLDPTPYRAEVTALERIIYVNDLDDIAGGMEEISSVATVMIQAVRGNGKDTHRNRTQFILYGFLSRHPLRANFTALSPFAPSLPGTP